jgi:hypothetical protein
MTSRKFVRFVVPALFTAAICSLGRTWDGMTRRCTNPSVRTLSIMSDAGFRPVTVGAIRLPHS